MLQSQKRFEFNPEFWDMRWGMKELKEGDTVMAACQLVFLSMASFRHFLLNFSETLTLI
jgi:hypothetical protein